MRAVARIVAEAGERGTLLTRLRGEPPLLLRQTGRESVHLVGGAAGPLGGDDLRIEIEVGPGATLSVRTVAASIALPGHGPSLVEVVAHVAAGATLYWLPEQLIAASRCDHHATSTVELADGAVLVWREELICGRHGEAPGNVRLHTSVTYAGRPLLRQTLAVGDRSPAWDSPAVLGPARATGSLLQVNGDLQSPAALGSSAWAPSAAFSMAALGGSAAAASTAGFGGGAAELSASLSKAGGGRGQVAEGAVAARSALNGPATLISAVAPDAHQLRELLKVSAP